MGLLGKFWNRKADADQHQGIGVSFRVPEENQPYEWRTENVIASPAFDAAPILSAARKYSCVKTIRVDRATGDEVVTGFSYYGDDESASALLHDIQSMKDGVKSVGIKGKFGTDARTIIPVAAGAFPSHGQKGLIMATVNPLTKTGKPPKNALSVMADATDGKSNGAIWHIDYLSNGTVNKADVHYWNNGIRHSFNLRRKGDALVVTWAGTMDREGDEVTLYRRDS